MQQENLLYEQHQACMRVSVHELTRASRGAWVGHHSLPRRTTPITQSCSQRQQLDHSRALPRACLFVSETNVIATAAMVTLHLPGCLRAEWGSECRGEDRQREVAASVLHSVSVREIYLTSCTLYLNTEDIPNITWPLLRRGCTGGGWWNQGNELQETDGTQTLMHSCLIVVGQNFQKQMDNWLENQVTWTEPLCWLCWFCSISLWKA